MENKVTGFVILVIILVVAATGIFLPKAKHNTIREISNQTESNRLNYNALSSMINVQNARLVKKNIELESKINNLESRVNAETLDAELMQQVHQFKESIAGYKFVVDAIILQNGELLQEIARLQELVVNHEEKIYNLEEKNKDFQTRFENAGQFLKDIADILGNINRQIMALEARNNIFQIKFEEICRYLQYVGDKVKEQPKVDIRCYKFHRPGCN